MWRPNKFSVRKRIPNGKCNHTQPLNFSNSLYIYVLMNEKMGNKEDVVVV